ncbi:MAG: hypothetical protein J5888_00390 [Bacteroidaceae bacterium]|nr:hypothetical protein [Bacteroidaceae bacterium]
MYARISFIVLFVVLVLTSCQEKKADFFEREAREYTQTYCPQKMDEVTTMDSIVFVKKEDRMGDLMLYYSLYLDDESRKILMDNLGELADMNLTDLRNSVTLTKYKEEKVEFTYIYHDATTGEKIVEYHFTPKDYQ